MVAKTQISMALPDDGAGTPQYPWDGVAEAFSIGSWVYDAAARKLHLLSPTLDGHDVPRRHDLSRKNLSVPRQALRDWMDGCSVGEATTLKFEIRRDPIAVRVVCTGRDGTMVSGLMQDVTNDELAAEGDLRFRMALKGAAHGIALVGLDGRWMQVNDAICDMLQYTEEEIRLLTFQDITHPDDLESDLDLLLECIEGKRNTYQMEKRYFRRDGEIIWVHLAVAILRADRGTPLYFISQIQDITAQKHAEAALVAARDEAKRASAAKSAFLASMSHEIRTPMTGVMGMLDMLQRSGVSGEQADLIGTARSSAEMLLSIINDVLDMAKLEAGKVEIASTDFSVDGLLRTVCDMMAARAVEKGLRFNAVLPLSTRIWLKGDPNRISQILFNLLGNAVKFTDAGEVSLKAETRPTHQGLDLVLSIADTGRGIPPDKIETVFEEFEQVQGERATRADGTGLGLAIVSRLVEAMRGTIDVESELGKGTVFTVVLPLAPGMPLSGDPVALNEAVRPRQGLKVLVVEDNAVNRKVIGSVLSIAGTETTYAHDGSKAIEIIRNRPFDIVFMDMMMPVMDGLTATRKLREMGYDRPILGLTANAMSSDRDACLEAGMNDHVAKPFRSADIFDALKKYSPRE
jgi:PAS domain S-box-containing protein